MTRLHNVLQHPKVSNVNPGDFLVSWGLLLITEKTTPKDPDQVLINKDRTLPEINI